VPNSWWVDKEDVVHIHDGISFSHREEWNCVVCRKMDGTRDHHVEQGKPNSKSQISHVFAHKQNLDLKWK
jgi:hypothetical protein